MRHNIIIWDLDGTLLDTLQDLHLSTNYALRRAGLPARTLEEVRQFVGNGVRKLIERSVPDGERNPKFEEVYSTFRQHYVEHCQEHTAPYPGIQETLQRLHAEGKRMAIVSNKLQQGVTELHQRWFADTVEVAVGEREGTQRKPAPDMVNIALREMGVGKEDAVYIGDSDVDLATAKNAGLPCISVLWGFRDREFLMQHGATCFVEHPNQIP